MNPPEIKNVTPLSVPGTSQPGTTRTNRRPLVIGAILALVVILGAYKLFHHHRNAYEATADAVTMAIARNDMTPVEHKFNAIRLPQLEDRARVGRLSDLLVPLGEFKGSKEITQPNAAPGFHEFTETFAKGTEYEKFLLDADGKIAQFYIGSPPANASTATAP